MNEERFRSFITGALLGVGLGILLTAFEDEEKQKDLKKSFSLLIEMIQDIDVEETKSLFLQKVALIKKELAKMDGQMGKEVAMEKVALIEKECDDLILCAQDSKALVVEKAALNVKENVKSLLNLFLEELEANGSLKENSSKKSSTHKKAKKVKKEV